MNYGENIIFQETLQGMRLVIYKINKDGQHICLAKYLKIYVDEQTKGDFFFYILELAVLSLKPIF